MDIKIYPKVFIADKKQTVFVQCNGDIEGLKIKIQPMEVYAIKHTPAYRVDEEERYSFQPLTKKGDGLYAIEYPFFAEQKYDVQIKQENEIIYRTRIYSVNADMVGINVFKGDTHLHTNRSDGEGSPFEVACDYRSAGYDFIAITDHHRYGPSLEAKAEIEPLTKQFTVFRGEEVHNKGMGYFHVVNFDGDFSINEIIETQDEYVSSEIHRILQTTEFDKRVADTTDCAYRIFIAEQIRKSGGIAIMAHPYWDVYGEYHMPPATVEFLLQNGYYDALELVAADDIQGHNGTNLQIAQWADLRTQGAKIPVLGASDSHSCTSEDSLFNKQYSLVFAKNFAGIKNAIKAEQSVAVFDVHHDSYFVYGQFRFVKYARFLLDEYFPMYVQLTKMHAKAIAEKNVVAIAKTEKALAEYKQGFFVWEANEREN